MGEKRKIKNQNLSLRSTEFRQLKFVEPITKVLLLDESYVWVPKTQDFAEDSSEEFEKTKVSGLGSVTTLPRVSSILQEVGILHTFVYFPL